MCKYIDLTVETYEEYFEISISGEGILLNSIMDIYCSTAQEVSDSTFIADLSYILCFIIYISLRVSSKYTLREVIVDHYRFLSSKGY